MGHLKIYCDGCGSEWNVYRRDDLHDHKARTCPVCGKSIDPGTWERQILRAFGEMEDATLELAKDHAQSHGTLFTVSYIPDVLFSKSKGSEDLDILREEVEDLKDGIDNLRSVTQKLIDGVFKF